MFEHLPLHGIQFVLNSVGHVETGVIVQQDDAMNEFTLMFILGFGMQLMKHFTITVCSNLLPCDFYIFGPLKKALVGHMFMLDNKVEETLVQWYRQLHKEFFADGIHQLVHQGDFCLNACDDFFNCWQYLHL
jgi:hypothetical protein